MAFSGVKFMDFVVDCPNCHERIALPPVACVDVLMSKLDTRYVTVELNDIPQVRHVCLVQGEGTVTEMTPGVSSIGDAYADKGVHGNHERRD